MLLRLARTGFAERLQSCHSYRASLLRLCIAHRPRTGLRDTLPSLPDAVGLGIGPTIGSLKRAFVVARGGRTFSGCEKGSIS
jgi:hypothetical protein